MDAALIRRHDDNPVSPSKLSKAFHQQVVQLLRG
jgi:hypothetical protein